MKKFTIFTIITLCILSVLPTISEALTAEEVRRQIKDTNSQIEALDKEIKYYQSQISKTSEQASSLSQIIKELTLTRTKLIKEKEQIEKKISATGWVIETLSNDILDKEKSIEISRKSLSLMIKDLNQNDDMPIVERLLSVENFTEFSREYNNILSLNEKIRNNILDISEKKDQLLSTKYEKESEKASLNTLKQTLVQKEQGVALAKKEKDTLLSQTKNKEAEYKKLLEERKKIKESFEQALEDYESQLKFILNPKSLPKEGSGALAWPLDYILVTSQYGSRWGRFHYGLDFRASVGTPVKAMATGVVEGVGDTDIDCKGASFGKWVFIRYNNGLSSTYGHLSAINTTVGHKVKPGDIVGLSGNTGSSTGPHLHVAVYASDGVKVDTVPSKSCNGKIFRQPISALTAYLNPALYLPTITPAMVKK